MNKLTDLLIKIFPFAEKYVTDIKVRTELFLRLGLTVNVGFAVYNIFTGVFYRSVWFGGVAVYYIMLCLIKFFLILRGFDTAPKKQRQYSDLLTCGIMLLILNITITALICQMIWQNKAHFYSEAVIYAAAVYTVFRLWAAAVDTLNHRKLHSPSLYASKSLSLSVALMALFSLQTSLLDRLGAAANLRRGLNIITGAIVGSMVITIAVRTIFKGVKLRKTKNRG